MDGSIFERCVQKPTHQGHRNHLASINRIFYHGSIATTIKKGILTSGVMYETLKAGIPYCQAGSIRDDGPLPETVTDMLTAQAQYQELIKGASTVLMLSTMLPSIATGNMLQSWVTTICVDINPAAVTKLSGKGSAQGIGIITDVGLFLKLLADLLD